MPKVPVRLNATMTGSLFPFFVQPRLICEVLIAAAVKLDGSFAEKHVKIQKVISLVDVFSVMLIKGFAVLSPAHDFEQGTVASVKVVLPDVPGQGQPPRLIVEPVLNMIPFAVVDVADMGYNPWCEVQLMLFGLI